MKKILLLSVAVLFLGTVTSAQAFFGIADTRNTDGAANVKIPVYNNSGSALDEGDVVVWDIGNATGDDDLYITTTTTADTGLVAGVVSAAGIGAGEDGSIIVFGLAQCDIGNQGTGAGGLLCTSATAGGGDVCASTDGSASYAIAGIAGVSGSQIECFVNIK